MKWKTVAAIIDPQSNDPKDLLNRSFAVSDLAVSTAAGIAIAFMSESP